MGLGEMDREEIWRWAEAVCEASLPPEDLKRLESRLQESREARVLFLHYLHLHGELYWHLNLSGAKEITVGEEDAERQTRSPVEPEAKNIRADILVPQVLDFGRQATLPGHWPSGSTWWSGQTLAGTLRRWTTRNWLTGSLLAGVVLAAVVITALPGLRIWGRFSGSPLQQSLTLPAVAQVAEVWTLAPISEDADIVPPAPGEEIGPGQNFSVGSEIRTGRVVVKLALSKGGEAIFEGPGRLQLHGENRFSLTEGALSVSVSQGPAGGYQVQTPFGSVRDLGTSFAIRVGQAEGEVHVFEGQVEVSSPAVQSILPDKRGIHRGGPAFLGTSEFHPSERRSVGIVLEKNQALRFVREGNLWIPETGKAEPGRFLRPEDSPPSVPRWRQVVQQDGRLAHLWSFEGWVPGEKLRDWRGGLDLHEVVMFAGAGGGRVEYFATGAGALSRAVSPFRATLGGNSQGVGLQTTGMFRPSDAFTVECLLAFFRPENPTSEDLCVVLGSRDTPDRCSFLIAADGYGQLLVAVDPNQGWLEVPFRLLPNEWYYLAVSFRKSNKQPSPGTLVDLWAAALNQPDPKLIRVLEEQWVAGWLVPGWLGVGKGFETNGAHAYPWPGPIDELAVYKEKLKEDEIAERFRILTGVHIPSGM